MSINRSFFFDQVRARLFGGKLSQPQVSGLLAILDYWEEELWNADDRWLAYALATAYHETDRKMQAIEEYGKGKGRTYGKPDPVTGQTYYGRGLVQLTWKYNYKAMQDIFGEPLVASPNRALNLPLAVKIMFHGMEHGTFTGKKFADYFNEKREDWVNARRIINGTDKARAIADYAKKFYSAISYTK
ncbi:MAG: hypothetical protein E6Q97_24050 [Desulfurellales bacterium]|nr:MAG: hypothetical protein E6Q97_24050 [Desulfurellales bacterium]